TSYTYLWYPEKDCFIERNVFNNAGRISVGARDVNVYIRKNTFYTDKPITNTPYVAENWASYGTSETIIKYNTFLNTDRITIGLPSGYDDGKIDAKENYWSTTDEAIIQSMIYDKNDDLSCAGYIAYQPFLSSPHQEAPLLETEITISTPKYFILCNNYPNPFNPTTTITYGLEKDCNVLISIYDISGKLITMLQNEYKTQGTHSITWNGVDDFGNKVGGGVYFYQVKAGDFIETKKMVLLK
ncbi:MAG: T9SS type A sorting domain-containing protein, partial [Planctomycetia bacterium]|nr:T9SS type A sorting domain-containing protein [Planctomycetia bacterium]